MGRWWCWVFAGLLILGAWASSPAAAITVGPVPRILSTSTSGPQWTGRCDRQVTLDGVVQQYGTAATVFFEYGPTDAYDSATPVEQLAAATTPVHVSATVSNAPETLHYELLIVEGGTTTLSDNQIYTFPSSFCTNRPVSVRSITATRSLRTVKVSLGCPGIDDSCTGSVRITAVQSAQLLGHASFRVRGGRNRLLSIQFTAAGRRLLESDGRVSARVVVTADDAHDITTRVTRRITL